MSAMAMRQIVASSKVTHLHRFSDGAPDYGFLSGENDAREAGAHCIARLRGYLFRVYA